MENKNFFSKNKILKKHKQDILKNETLIELLNFKIKKPIILNPTLIKDKAKYTDSENQIALEGKKLIYELNKNYEKNMDSYYEKKKETENFSKTYRQIKTRTNKNKFQVIENNKLILGHLLNKYENKGINFQGKFFDKEIFNISGILLRRKKLMEDYFSNEIKKEGNRSTKIIKYKNFLSRLSNHIRKKLIKKLHTTSVKIIKQKKGKEYKIGQLQRELKKKKEIQKLKSDNNFLKKLIETDKNNIITNEDSNNMLMYTNNCNSKNYSRNNNVIDFKNLDSKNKSNISINNMSSLENEDLKVIDIIKKKLNRRRNNDNKEYYFNYPSTFGTNNEITKTLTIKKSDNSLTNRSLPHVDANKNKIKEIISFNKTNYNNRNKRVIESDLFKTRLKENKKDNYIYPSLEEIINEKKIITNKRKLQKTYSLNNTNRTSTKNKTISSQPNFSLIEDTYRRAVKYGTVYENKKLEEIVKKFEEINNKGKGSRNEGVKIFNFFSNLKANTIKNEKNDNIYSKYRDLLSDEFKKKIILNKKLNKKLKRRPEYFAQSYCTKFHKLSQKKDII